MLTKEETAEIIHKEFFKEGGLKDSLIKEIDEYINAKIGKWIVSGGIITVFIVSGAWISLSNKVNNNTEKIEKSLTQDQAALIIQRVDQLTEVVKDRNEIIAKIDERLRAKGI